MHPVSMGKSAASALLDAPVAGVERVLCHTFKTPPRFWPFVSIFGHLASGLVPILRNQCLNCEKLADGG